MDRPEPDGAPLSNLRLPGAGPAGVSGLVDHQNGLVDRRGFSDPDIYQLELERIFARAWLFMAHDSQIPNPGDFFMTFMGEDRVIVVRDNDGNPQVLINSCRHRGNAVCRAEEGHATSFMCTYHGWTYDLQGKLVGVPGSQTRRSAATEIPDAPGEAHSHRPSSNDVHHEDLDRESWGLISAAQVDSYQGFIFATMDPEAPCLEEYLGEVGRIGLGTIAARGDMQVVPGVQKYVLSCNWKFPVENGYGDWYHALVTHASARLTPWTRPPPPPISTAALQPFAPRHLVLLGEHGHSISGPLATFLSQKREPWRESAKGKELLGPTGVKARGFPGLFPNCWILGHQLCLSQPRGPDGCEVWLLTFMDRDLDEGGRKDVLFRSIHTLGPAGMLEQDDAENWGQSSLGTKGRVSGGYPLNLALGKGHATISESEAGPFSAENNANEHAQLWLHRNWAHYLASENWAELRANRPDATDHV